MKIKRPKDEGVAVGSVVSFKVPDQQFADLFNGALKATNSDKSRLTRESVQRGLAAAVWAMSEGREKALETFQKLNAASDPSSARGTRLKGFVKLAEAERDERRKTRGSRVVSTDEREP